MSLTKAKTKELRSIKTNLDGYVNTKYEVLQQFADREFVQSALYDQSVNGDIPVTTTAEDGVALGMSIPIGACISDMMFDVQTALTASGGTATLDVQLATSSTVEAGGVIVNNHAEANLSVGAKKPTLIPMKTTAVTDVYLTAATAKFEKGKMRVFVKYYMARD